MALIRKSEAAKRAGVTWQAIHKHKKSGAAWFEGNFVNSEHPEFKAFCLKRGYSANPTHIQADTNVTGLTETKRRRLEAQAAKAELDLAIAKKELVELDFMKVLVFDYLQMLNKRILSMGGNTADRVLQIVASGDENARQKIIDLWSREASKEIKQTKIKIQQNINKIIKA